MRGGAALRLPVLEKVAYLSLNVISIPLRIQRAYTKEGVAVTDTVVLEGVRQIRDSDKVEFEEKEPAEVMAQLKNEAE